MAGSGFKTFVTGEVLTSTDVNGYLMQGVLVFASAAARDAAITAPTEGMYCYLKDTNVTYYYDGATWVVSGATGDITAVTAGTGISGGGASGDVTITNSMATAYTTKGDLVPATGSATFSRLGVGANDTVLTADSTAATGLKWGSPVSGGMTLLSTTAITAASSITVSSISASYTNLQIVISNMALATANEYVRMTFNGVSTATYSWNYLQGATVQAGGSLAYITLANQFQNLAATGNSIININVPLYSNTASWKTMQFSVAGVGGSGNVWVGTGSSNNTAAISSFTISTTSAAFAAQGNIYVYGVK